jgi:hypothetical protein
MSKTDWNSPEDIAFFEREWDHAIMQAKVAFACACEEGGASSKCRSCRMRSMVRSATISVTRPIGC